MKNIIVTLAASVFFAFQGIGNHFKEKTEQTSAKQILKISVEAEIGSKKSNCKRFGFHICRLLISTELNVVKPNGGLGELSTSEDGKLRLVLKKSSMTPEGKLFYFGGSNFRVDEDFPLPDEITQKLQIENYVIKKGVYPFRETLESYEITF